MYIDPLAIIEQIGKEVLSVLYYTLLYVIVVPIAIWLKRIIADTDFWLFLQFWNHRHKLFNHKIFNQITEIYSIKYQFNIVNTGRKLCFGELLSTEIEAINGYLFDFLKHTYKNNFYQFLKQGYHSVSKDFIIDKLLTDYMNFINLSHEYLLNKYLDCIWVDSVDDTVESEIILKIKVTKLRAILSAYERIMLPYRNQIFENLQEYYNSDKRSHEILEDIFNNCYSPVLRNIRKTIPLAINRINGELKGIVWNGHLL